MSDQVFSVTCREQIERATATMIQAGEGFRTPLLRAAAEGLLSITFATGGTPIPAKYLKLKKPMIALLCDDHEFATGPGRWQQARKLFRWADAAILHATGGQEQHYALAAVVTLLSKRVVMVEMRGDHHDAWRSLAEQFLPPQKLISIVPLPGDCHSRPSAPAGEMVH